MKKTILDLIKKTKADALENMNAISRDLVDDNDLESIDYLGDLFTEQADEYTSLYYADQRKYYYDHAEECENALLDYFGNEDLADLVKKEGLDGLICKAGAVGEYQANISALYEDEDKIKECLTLDYLERYIHADELPPITEEQLGEILNECHDKELDEIIDLIREVARGENE